MKHMKKIFTVFIILSVVVLAQTSVVFAVPPLPSSMYGTVTVNNENVPDGTVIEALINNQVVAYAYTQTYQGNSVYSLDVPGDDSSTTEIEGGIDDDAITFKIGGTAKYFVEVRSEGEIVEAIEWAQKNGKPFFILSGGSNVLIPDRGYNGLVIYITHKPMDVNGEQIDCFAGCALGYVIDRAIDTGLCGIEKLAGIPGSIGGAVRGNAGAFGVEVKDMVDEVSCVSVQDGKVARKTFSNNECDFEYRTSFFKSNPKWIIAGVKISLQEGDKEEAKKIAADIVRKRNEKQDQGAKCAGSFFKNPVVSADIQKEFEKDKDTVCKDEKVPAGWLIEKVGLENAKVGGACVSPQHANYIVNTGNATFNDVYDLMNLIKQGVQEAYGVELEEEVQILK